MYYRIHLQHGMVSSANYDRGAWRPGVLGGITVSFAKFDMILYIYIYIIMYVCIYIYIYTHCTSWYMGPDPGAFNSSSAL